MADLREFRNQIDNIDKEIVKLFEKRMEIVLDVAKYKKQNHIPVLDSSREEEVINKNIGYLKNKELENYLRKFYINFMNLSKDYQSIQINRNPEDLVI
jgi:monofunctional chorismate mutase